MKKRLFIPLSIAMLSSSVFAFDSGTYVCPGLMTTEVYILKDNERAKHLTLMGTAIMKTERGDWRDDDDAAEVIKESTVIEQNGNKFHFQTPDAGAGICQKTTEKAFFNKLEKIKKENIKRANSPEAIKARKEAKRKADIKTAKERANYYANTWTTVSRMPANVQLTMLNQTITSDYNKQSEFVKKLIRKDLDTMGVKVPTINSTTQKTNSNNSESQNEAMKIAKKKAKDYIDVWTQVDGSPMAGMMIKGMITPDYNKQSELVKKLIKKELDSKGIKIPTVNK